MPRVTDSWWYEARGREVQHAQAGLPRAQAQVDVLVGHRVALVEQPHALEQLAREVHAGARHRQHGTGQRGGAPVVGLEAVAVVEPLGRASVAHRAGELDAPVGVQQPRADDADVVLLRGRVLQARQPAGLRLHVRVQHDDVARGVRSRAGRG